MTRKEQLSAAVSEMLQSRLHQEAALFEEAVRLNGQKTVADVLLALQIALERAGQLQTDNRKGAVSFIGFSILFSNLFLGEYAIQINVYDEKFLVDDQDASAAWDFSLLMEGIDPSFAAVERVLKRSMARVQDYEIVELLREYRINYYVMALELACQAVSGCMELLRLPPVELASEIHFTAGLYMEAQRPFFVWRP